MIKKRIKQEDIVQIIEKAYSSKGLKVPKYKITILKKEVSIAIDLETSCIEFGELTDLIEEIAKEMKKYNVIKRGGTFFYKFYVIDFYSK